MPAKRPTPEKEYFRNTKTWKQVTTNVPPQMLEVLKSRVTEDFTMSHVLRELIAESSLMRYGQLPRPRWCADLIDQVGALKEEVAQLRKDIQTMSPPAEPVPVQKAKANAIGTVLPPSIRSVSESPDYDDLIDFEPSDDPDFDWCQKIIQEVIEEDEILESADEKEREKAEYMSVESEDEPVEEMQKEPAQEKIPDGKTLFGRLTEMLGVSRKTA